MRSSCEPKRNCKIKKSILMAISWVFLSSHYNVEANELEWMDRRALHSKQSAQYTCSIRGNLFSRSDQSITYVKRLHLWQAMYVLSLFLRSDQWLMLIADIHRPSSEDELLLYIRKKVLCDDFSILRDSCCISSSDAKNIKLFASRLSIDYMASSPRHKVLLLFASDQ